MTTDPIAFAADAFAALNLTWKDAPAKSPAARALGVTADQAALMDVTTRRGKLVGASAVTPVKAEYTPLLVFLLAALVEKATMQEADRFLARQLGRLRRDRPSQVTAPWHQWRVTLTTNALGLLTMQVR
jgi:hypothetical protein